MKRRTYWIIGLVVLIALGGLFWRGKNKPIEVETADIFRGDIERSIKASGELVASDSDRVFAPLSGQIINLPLTEGFFVNQGDIILEYDDIALKNTLAQAKSTLAIALKAEEDLIRSTPIDERLRAYWDAMNTKKIIYDQAQTDYEGDPTPSNRETLNTTLSAYRDAVASYEEIKRTVPTDTALDSARKAVRAAESALDKAKSDLEKTTLVVPKSGILIYESSATISKIGIGSTVTQGQIVFTIVAPETLKFAAEIDEKDISQINKDQDVRIELNSTDKIFKAKISSIDQKMIVASSGAEVFLVRLNFLQPDKDFRLGMNGEATFILETKKNILKVPIEAVFEEEDKNIVYIENNGTAEKKVIELGAENDEYYELKSGLSEKDEVLIGENMKDIEKGTKIIVK